LSKNLLRSTLLLLVLSAVAAPPAMAAPDPSFTVAPDPPTAGVPATLTSTSTPTPLLLPLATITLVEWDWNNDGTYDATGDQVTHAFAAAGAQTFTMRVTDSALVDNQATEVMTVNVNAPPTVSFAVRPEQPWATEEARFDSTAADPEGGRLTYSWDFGDGSGPDSAANPRHTFASPGTKTVRVVVTDPAGGRAEAVRQVVVRSAGSPTASFRTSPTNPTAGDRVTFTSTSRPSAGEEIRALRWDLDNDGDFDDDEGASATRGFAEPGVYRIALRVTQSNDKRAVAEGTVRVGSLPESPRPSPPGGGNPPGTGPGNPPGQSPGGGSPRARPALLNPFPIVKLKGDAYVDRTVVEVLRVRAPRGALAAVRCTGRGCPKVVRRKRSQGRPLRFRTFERTLGVGAEIEVFVRKPGRIGKYARFKLRSRKWPLRIDKCLVPRRSKPQPCPPTP
jgi:PKD repeat protein